MSSEESSSSSSEDELPLSSLKNSSSSTPTRSRRRSSAAAPTSSYKEQSDNEDSEEDGNEEEEDGNDDDDDEEDDDDDDDDDDEPVSALRSPKSKAKPKSKSTAATKKKATKAKPTAAKAKLKTKTKAAKKMKVKADSPTPPSSSSSAIQSSSSELYAKSKKGKLISELLRRWWYAFSWPDPSVLNKVPPNCDKFDGFPGVFVVTQGEDVGKIVDLRDQAACPCFRNMALKSSEELKGLLLKAIEEQRKILIDHEGQGTQTEQDLKGLEKWAEKVNATTADKEAEKVLKAANIKLV